LCFRFVWRGFFEQRPAFLTLPCLHAGFFAVSDSLPLVPRIVRMSGGGGIAVPGPWHSSDALHGTSGGT
jgi:hypothetical protein